ncbi:ATP-binding cassette sub- A member 3 [Bulinus truncatus]|nr:ATP-binding cassette sub- A member 3 [Bulinus truncatus]
MMMRQHVCTAPAETNALENPNVQEERAKVGSELEPTNCVILRNVTKRSRHWRGQTCSVCNVCALIPPGECLGLLGPNGAGKSLILQMIAGMETLTSGDIVVNGMSVRSQMNSICRLTSYCSQNIPLAKRLTGREALVFFARLKGVPHDSIDGVVNSIVYFVELSAYETLLVKYYSESSKRKLILGICILGVPQFLLLDNPTSGIDFVARRKIWAVMDMIRDHGSTVVLGSNSTDDCDTLCSRVAFMRDGRFTCLDEPEDYLSKRDRGFVLTLHPKNEGELEGRRVSLDDAVQFVLSSLPEAEVLTRQNEFVEIHASETVLLSDAFEALIKAKMIHLIGRYTVQRLSLDHVRCNGPKENDPDKTSTLVE